MLVRAAEEWSQRAPEPFYDHAPAWLSTWTEHAALLDSPSPQPDGEHFLTLPLLNDYRWFPLSPPSPQDRIAQARRELPIPHRFQKVRCTTTGRCPPEHLPWFCADSCSV